MWEKDYKIRPIGIFLLYLLFSALYGAIFMADNYWDWKLLYQKLMVFLLPLASFAYAKPIVLKKTLSIWFKYAWIILIFLFPFLESDAFGRYLVPCSFLSLFLAYLNKKYLLVVSVAYIITMVYGFESRSDMLKFSVTVLLGLIGFISLYKNFVLSILKIAASLLVVLPIILLVLGVSGVFNIFSIEEEWGLNDKYTIATNTENEYNALADTRTFLYLEEISSAIKNNYVIFGRSPARGYDSVAFAEADMVKYRSERGSCEVSILNVFNYFGLVGVFIYFWIFIQAIYLALNKSNNIFVPIIGTCVAFRWMFAWVEDFSKFDLNYLFLWIMIGICFSPWYRNMSNDEIKNWIKSIMR